MGTFTGRNGARAHAALTRWPELALAYAAGGRSDVAPAWVPEVFDGIDPDALRGLALQRIERCYGPRAARAAADLAARGTRADLDALVLGLGWRGASHPADGLRAAATVAVADLDRRARRFARTLVFALALLGAVALGVFAGSGGANLDAGSALGATVGLVLGTAVGSLLLGYAGRIDAAEGRSWGTLLRDLTRPPSDAAERWHALTSGGPILDRLRAAWDDSRAALTARTRTHRPARSTPLRGATGRGAPPLTGPPARPWANLPGSTRGAPTVN